MLSEALHQAVLLVDGAARWRRSPRTGKDTWFGVVHGILGDDHSGSRESVIEGGTAHDEPMLPCVCADPHQGGIQARAGLRAAPSSGGPLDATYVRHSSGALARALGDTAWAPHGFAGAPSSGIFAVTSGLPSELDRRQSNQRIRLRSRGPPPSVNKSNNLNEFSPVCAGADSTHSYSSYRGDGPPHVDTCPYAGCASTMRITMWHSVRTSGGRS